MQQEAELPWEADTCGSVKRMDQDREGKQEPVWRLFPNTGRAVGMQVGDSKRYEEGRINKAV